MQADTSKGSEIAALALQLERDLMNSYGSPLLTGEKLAEAMGYRSIHSLRKHMSQRTFPVKLFNIEGRRGRFVLVKDIACWLATQRLQQPYEPEETPIEQ